MALVFNEKLEEGFKYIPESQVNESKPFTVTIKPIDSVRLVTLEDGLLKRDKNNSLTISTGSYNVSLLENAITDWKNMTDAKNKALPIALNAAGFIAIESLSKIPTSLITEIANVVSAVSQDPSKIQLFSADVPEAMDK